MIHQLKTSLESISTKNIEIQTGILDSNQKAQKLNETYTKLVEINSKLEKLKKLSTAIHSYQGILKNKLCMNSQNTNTQNCDDLSSHKNN